MKRGVGGLQEALLRHLPRVGDHRAGCRPVPRRPNGSLP